MNYFKLFCITSLLTFIIACAKPERVLPQNNSFFSLTDFIENEVNRLNTTELTLYKTILKNDELKDTVIDNPEWESELSSFILLDINKKNLIDDYKVDTVKDKSGSYRVFYENISGKEKVQTMNLYFTENHKLIIMEIETSKNKLFVKESLTFSYQPLRGYGIKGWKKAFFADKVEIDIFGNFSGEEHPLEVR